MALVGGGGAPNVSGGSNPAGTGSVLNYVGDHAYAYSGVITSDGTNVTTGLEFATGNNLYIVGTFEFDYVGEENQTVRPILKVDGEIVAQPGTKYGDPEPIKPIVVKVILNSNSQVNASMQMVSAQDDFAIRFTGRVYA
jgi:hypothetical protein